MTSRRRRRPDPERIARRAARREELLDAAMAEVRARGPEASMSAIAARAGVTKPILYRHVGDRAELTAALADRFGDLILERIQGALSAAPDPRSMLAASVDGYLAVIEEDPELYRFLTVRLPAETPEATAALFDRIARDVAVVLGEQLRAVGADAGPTEAWAYGMVGMVHLAGHWWLGRRTMSRDALVGYLTQLLWDGLGARTAVPLDLGGTP